MNLPPSLSRRSFLTRLLAAAGVTTLAAHAAKDGIYKVAVDPSLPGSVEQDRRGYTVQGVAIKVPSNRHYTEVTDDIMRNGYHPGVNAYHFYLGDWDGTFKLERGCTNPAYVWADMCERSGKDIDWRSIYRYGKYCDDPVCGSDNVRISIVPLSI